MSTSSSKAVGIAKSFISLYGPQAELRVAQRILMFEAEGNMAAVEAWRAVGEALSELRQSTGADPAHPLPDQDPSDPSSDLGPDLGPWPNPRQLQ